MKNKFLYPILLLAIAVLGCSSLREFGTKTDSDNSSSNSSSSNVSDEKPDSGVTASSDPKADIEKMSKRFVEQTSFRAKMDGSGKTPFNVEVAYVAPDRFHMKYGTTMEMIAIGKDSYTRSGGSWQKANVDLGKTISSMRDNFTDEGLKLISDVKNENDDNMNGQPSLVYSYNGKSPADGIVHNARIWISKASGLPQKIEATYPSGDLKKAVISYEYPADLVIESPIKNK